MQKFTYKAWDENFNILQGVIEEEEAERVKEILRSKGLKVIDIRKKSGLLGGSISEKKLNDEEISGFCGQIGMIVSSGVSILKGLEVLEQQVKNKRMKGIIKDVLTGVRRGKTLASSMSDTGKFPKLLTDIVMTGETSGNLDNVLFNMENYYQREAAVKSKVKSASIYPIILLVVSVGLMIFFNVFVFSEMKDMLMDNGDLPALTSFVLGSIEFLNNNFLYIWAGLAVLVFALYRLSKVPKVKYRIDKWMLKAPVIGAVKMEIITSRFTRSMALFLKSAVPILDILDNVQLIIGNEYIGDKLGTVKKNIINGESIADTFDEEKMFEPVVVQMIRVGEETGRLEEMLFKLSDIYDKRVETSISRMVALIEPMFTIIVGVFVGFIIVAMAMPIMNMSINMK